MQQAKPHLAIPNSRFIAIPPVNFTLLYHILKALSLFVILCQKEVAMAFDLKKEYKMFYKPIAYQKAVASKEKS